RRACGPSFVFLASARSCDALKSPRNDTGIDMTNLHRSPPMNQSETDLGIVNESQLLRFGVSRKAICGACPLRTRCLAPKGVQRSIGRWEHEDVLVRHRARMQSAGAGDLMRRRSAIVEHPFGTIKCRAGYRHFLVRGFNKVRGEWSLMALCYNFTRVLNILGFERFVACMVAKMLLVHKPPLVAGLPCIQLAPKAFRAQIISWFAISRLGPAPAYGPISCPGRSEEHTSELQSLTNLVCRL